RHGILRSRVLWTEGWLEPLLACGVPLIKEAAAARNSGRIHARWIAVKHALPGGGAVGDFRRRARHPTRERVERADDGDTERGRAAETRAGGQLRPRLDVNRPAHIAGREHGGEGARQVGRPAGGDRERAELELGAKLGPGSAFRQAMSRA